jgi:hypothetical protein
MFSHSVAQAYKLLHILQSASRFESVLLAAIKVAKHQHKRCKVFGMFHSSLPLFSVEQVSHASAHVMQASMQF